jgi:hypothetical protein
LVSVVVFSEWLNGAAVTAAPEFVPSTLNCTLVVFDDTVVVTVTVPDTVAPDTGELIDMVGAAPLFTVIGTAALVVCPEASLATAVSEWLPLASAVVFSVWLNGAAVTAAPEFVPSTLNCTLVVFDDTVVVTITVPDTVAPGAGVSMETWTGALPGLPAAVRPTHPKLGIDKITAAINKRRLPL